MENPFDHINPADFSTEELLGGYDFVKLLAGMSMDAGDYQTLLHLLEYNDAANHELFDNRFEELTEDERAFVATEIELTHNAINDIEEFLANA